MSKKISLGAVNRVEGDLQVKLNITDNSIESAQISSTLFRGVENLMLGKTPMDALTITPRVCGICSVSQSVAAAKAIANFANIEIADNGQRVTNILLATEMVADILTHFYLFFMPDFCHSSYQDMPWHAKVSKDFTAISGDQHGPMLKARAEFLHIMGILAGKWPHSMVFQPGGVSKVVSMSEKIKLQGIVASFKQFLENQLFGDKIEHILAFTNEVELRTWQQNAQHSHLNQFLAISESLKLNEFGQSYDQLLAFPTFQGCDLGYQSGGVQIDGAIQSLNIDHIIEHHKFAKLHGESFTPEQGLTQPNINKQQAYTWCKAPRYDGRALETGALARQVISGDPLATSLFSSGGANVHTRMISRLIELAKLVAQIEKWIVEINPQHEFCNQQALSKDGTGVGLSEAARGSLGHWFQVENGKIVNYQIVAPTSWNFSPRDNNDHPGPLEFALQELPYETPKEQQMMQHIIRSFDPCMLCTVH